MRKDMDAFRQEATEMLLKAKNKEAFSQSLSAIVQALGFSNFDILDIRNSSSISGALTTMPDPMLDTYFRERMYEDDLALNSLYSASFGLFCSNVYESVTNSPFKIRRFEKALRPYELLRNYQLYDIYCYPISKQNERSSTIFSVLSEAVSPSEFKRQVLEHNVKIMHLANVVGCTIARPDFDISVSSEDTPVLTDRQRDILIAMASLSMTQKQAANYLHLSLETVQMHCKNIMKKMNKPSLIAAFYEALRLGQISIKQHAR